MAFGDLSDDPLTDAQKQSAVDMGLYNKPNQNNPFVPPDFKSDPAETNPEYADLRAIREKLPGAMQDVATAEGRALRTKAESDIAGAEGNLAAAKQRSADVRGSYDAYGERIAKEPLPAFVPSEDNAETLGALFSGVNLLGLIMSRGAGRSSALGAMSSMTGMLEGYRTGRKDLYEREKQIFEKNYARIKDIHAQYGKELDQALKLSEVNFEEGKMAALLAAKRAGNKYAEDMASVGNLKAVVAAYTEEVKIIDKMNNIRKSEDDREARLEIAALRQKNQSGLTPGAVERNRYTRQSAALTTMDNLIGLASDKEFQKVIEKYRAQAYFAEAGGKLVSQLITPGLPPKLISFLTAVQDIRNQQLLDVSGKAVTVAEQMRSYGVMPQPGDKPNVLLSKLNYMRGKLSSELQEMQNMYPVLPTLSGGARQPSASPSPAPSSAGSGTQDIEKLANARYGSFEPNKYEYGTNPNTGNFGRRPK